MKRAIWIILILVILGALGWEFYDDDREEAEVSEISIPDEQGENTLGDTEVVAQNLSVPWDMVWLSDGSILVTERTGQVVLIRNGQAETVFSAEVSASGEGGLLGMTLHPNFSDNNFIYLYQTAEASDGLVNRVTRHVFDLDTNSFGSPEIIIDNIPGARYHDGGRIRFGPDGYLYITTGDAGVESSAQDLDSLAGKILRLTDEGEIPADNPFGTAIYSYGHRNPQGLAWDDQNRLWSTEHGRSGLRSGFDELNLIKAGGNYGWPVIQGDEVSAGMISPVLHSGPTTTWAPASLAYLDGQLWWAGLRGETLYRVDVTGEEVSNLTEFLAGEFGRLRTVVAQNGDLYISTSNTDGRGSSGSQDDQIIRFFTN